jgi:ribosome-binding protein aMBF1 (putative translation factor)
MIKVLARGTVKMVRLSELRTAGAVHEQDMRDLDYRREYERTRLANDVAVKVIRYRVDCGLSQADLGKMLGMRQPHVARLGSGDHEPSLSTLSRLASALGLDFSVTVKPDRMGLRYVARGTSSPSDERKRA